MTTTHTASATPAAPTSKAAARMKTAWKYLRLTACRDPLARVTTPAAAIELADILLVRTAVARTGSGIWCGVAVSPLAALITAASPAGQGSGIGWLRSAVSALHTAAADDTHWDAAEMATSRLATDTLRTAVPRLRGFNPRQRQNVTLMMNEALVASQRRYQNA